MNYWHTSAPCSFLIFHFHQIVKESWNCFKDLLWGIMLDTAKVYLICCEIVFWSYFEVNYQYSAVQADKLWGDFWLKFRFFAISFDRTFTAKSTSRLPKRKRIQSYYFKVLTIHQRTSYCLQKHQKFSNLHHCLYLLLTR